MKKKLNKILPKSEFTKNVLTLMTGTTIAQAIPVAISPILTRIYTPEDFGVLALFVAITSIFGSIANARYELAIMLPETDEDAINIFALALVINILLCVFLFIIVLLFHDLIISVLGSEKISFWLYMVPLVVFFIGLYNALTYFNNRKKQYRDLRNATILKSVILAITQLSIGLIKQGAAGLISGRILSHLFANAKLLRNIIDNKVLLSYVAIKKMVFLGKKNINFVKFNVPSTLANNFSLQLPLLMLPKIYNLTISGHFSLSQKLIALPSSLLATSISQVYFQAITENKNNNIQNMPLLIKTIKKLILIALPISILIFLFSSKLFIVVFGENWALSGQIAKYLALVFFIVFVVSVISITLVAYERLKLLAVWQFLYLLSALVLYLLCFYYSVSLETFLLFYVVHEYILRSLYLYFIFITVKQMDYKIVNE